LFDQNNDGVIDGSDLRATFKTMGMEVTDETIQQMLDDASQPIDFDSFAMMMCFKTMELEPEIVLLEALSKWDERIQGVISLERWQKKRLI
jgi:myosin regulatory light chain 12